jgi:hypothetical protein
MYEADQVDKVAPDGWIKQMYLKDRSSYMVAKTGDSTSVILESFWYRNHSYYL